jgi:hypothetical protein
MGKWHGRCHELRRFGRMENAKAHMNVEDGALAL